MISYVLTFIVAIFLSALFSGVETGIVRIDPIKLNVSRQQGSKRAILMSKLYEKKEELLAMTLIGNNLSVTVASAVATSFLLNLFDFEEKGSLIVMVIVTPVILFFGEIVPKSVFLYRSTQKTTTLAPIIALLHTSFYPLIRLITAIANIILTTIPTAIRTRDSLEREDLQLMLDLTTVSEEGHRSEQIFLSRFLTFNVTQAREVMKPLIDITALPVDASLERFAQTIRKTGYSRILVYDGQPHTIVGLIHAKDILFASSREKANLPPPPSILNQVSFVPETKRIAELLPDMQRQSSQTVVVIDEYGASVGMITIEDILEEIFGDIQDEYDPDEKDWVDAGSSTTIVRGRLELTRFKEKTGVDLRGYGFTTIAGWIEFLTGRIPGPGESLTWGSWKITVLEGTKQRIDRIQLDRLDQGLRGKKGN